MTKPFPKLELPQSFQIFPFYEKQQVIDGMLSEKAVYQIPFLYDLLYINRPNQLEKWPWQEACNFFHAYWKERSETLRVLFRQRDQALVRKPMVRCIAAFIDQLCWSAGAPVSSLVHDDLIQQIKDAPCAPLNIEERLGYLLRQPARYLAFIQLDELEQEFTKKRAANMRRLKKD
ncbi:YpoC family protein [Sporolactobacillus inulinus]|uniref:YpoC family protein n=1 Tax=Sporolactobacillus inulinus TaxID=2078 RepID=UPI000255C467|nr:hypothetical protein [Sporolactobacillus inulinus]GEB76086.1 hypothetical protein SIN01_04310 [Sporolactobacillus inulinus]